jgi:hypothetical protein
MTILPFPAASTMENVPTPRIELTVGPVLYWWPRQALTAF